MIELDFLAFALAGFVAQLIDVALGMAYGVTCTSLLLAFGVSPAAASASVHMAEIVTSGVSGHFHWRLGNVDRELFRHLVWSGMAGGVLGAYALASVSSEVIKPWIALYLAVMGMRIVVKVVKGVRARRRANPHLGWLGFTGGFFDAVGGGGWGPIVTSTLVGRGYAPRTAIGSVNRAEFFVTVVQSATFIALIGVSDSHMVLALSLGGALAAPVAAYVVRAIQPRRLMLVVGLLIMALSLQTLIGALWSTPQHLPTFLR